MSVNIEEAILTKHVAAFEACSDCGIVLGKLLGSAMLSEFEYQQIRAERTQIERNRLARFFFSAIKCST